MLNQYSLLPLHISETVSFSQFRVPIEKFPIEGADNCLYAKKSKYAEMKYESILFEGGYGILQKCKRTDLSGLSVDAIVKRPKENLYLGSEAILQWIARKTLEPYNLHTHIPQVYDIFRRAASVSFSLEFIQGDFPYIYLARVPNPDVFFYQLLAQVCAILYYLEKDILMDHRDLKANNLYIREVPVDYTLEISGVSYRIKAPFQVIILDFGFACVGDVSGITKMNTAPDIFPSSDPCPKEGRDLFHLITSFWSIPSIRQRMSIETRAEVDSWLIKDKKDFSKLTRTLSQTDWVYIVTGDPNFVYPKLSPLSILKRVLA